MPNVLVLGSQGRFGLAVTEAFSAAGWQVKAQSRRNAVWPSGVEDIRCDAMEASGLVEAARGMDVVVNALNPPYTEWESHAKPLAANALAAAETAGALLMFPGNVYNFGRLLPPRLDAETPNQPDTRKGRIRIEIENEMKAAAFRKVNSIVVRAGDFFGGKGRGAWFDLIVGSIAKGKVIYPGPPDTLHAWAYLPDLAETFVRLAEIRHRLEGFRQFHFAGHAVTGRQLHRALEYVTGRSLRLQGMPWGLIGIASPLWPMAKAVSEMRYLWQRPHALEDDLAPLLRSLPETPLELALSSALRDIGYGD